MSFLTAVAVTWCDGISFLPIADGKVGECQVMEYKEMIRAGSGMCRGQFKARNVRPVLTV